MSTSVEDRSPGQVLCPSFGTPQGIPVTGVRVLTLSRWVAPRDAIASANSASTTTGGSSAATGVSSGTRTAKSTGHDGSRRTSRSRTISRLPGSSALIC
jgi:hypothetical protein